MRVDRSSRGSASIRRTMGRTLAGLVLASGLGGCAQYHWSKDNTLEPEFHQESLACAREAAPTPTAASQGVINDQMYRACLRARGWVREKQWDPPPPGWYRGIE